MESAREPDALDDAVRAVRAALQLASNAYQHAAAARDDLAAAHEEAAKLEATSGATKAAQDRHRNAKRSSNEAIADRARAKDLTDGDQ